MNWCYRFEKIVRRGRNRERKEEGGMEWREINRLPNWRKRPASKRRDCGSVTCPSGEVTQTTTNGIGGKKEANEPFRLVTVTSAPSRITEFDANWKPCPPAFFFFCSFFCLRPRTVSSTSSNSFHGHVPRLRTGGYFTLVPHLRSDSSQNFLSLFQRPRTKWRRNFKALEKKLLQEIFLKYHNVLT